MRLKNNLVALKLNQCSWKVEGGGGIGKNLNNNRNLWKKGKRLDLGIIVAQQLYPDLTSMKKMPR